MTPRAVLLLLAASCLAGSQAATLRESAAANPVRKVVSMLQAMSKKVLSEGEREEELFNKFMCYCKTGTSDLTASIDAAETRIPELTAELGAADGALRETKEGLEQDKADREAAKGAIAEATAMREKDNAAFTKAKDEYVANIGAIQQAVAALEKGSAGVFLQTRQAARLQQLVEATKGVLEEDRQQVLSFLSGTPFSQGYAPQSGQITGILRQLGDSMATALATETSAEEKAVHIFQSLAKAKTDEVDALTEAIEAKSEKIGELGVFQVTGKDDLDDLEEGLAEDKKFMKSLQSGCATKEAEWEERQKTRSAELLALSQTIKTLNDDDALELFKKTLPSASASFVQVQASVREVRARAAEALGKARRVAPRHNRASLDMILLTLNGKAKAADFTKVIKMIDGMVAMLAEEQKDDEKKKVYCEKQLDESDDKKKDLEHTMETEANEIQKAKTAIETLTEEIAALVAGVKKLDSEVAEATEMRKEENAEYKDLMASNTAAKELLDIAKNRLNKFYNPSLYKAPAKKELDAQSAIARDFSFVQVGARSRASASGQVAPPPPPETWEAYAKKGEEGTGVIAMIDLLIKDLVLEMTEAETAEKEGQKDYEQMMADSAEKRAADSKTIADKEQNKADAEVSLQSHKGAQLEAFKEHQNTLEYMAALHADCDWLVQFFDVRKEARAGEVDALKNAKAVLSGASYSLLETRTRHHFLSRD